MSVLPTSDQPFKNDSRASTPSLSKQNSRSPSQLFNNDQFTNSPHAKSNPHSISPGSLPHTLFDEKKSKKLSPDNKIEKQQQKLTDLGWNKQHLNDFHGFQSTATQNNGNGDVSNISESSHTTVEWQNELARHILSMYASTTANNNLNNSKAILKFVDNEDSEKNIMNIIDKTIFDESIKKRNEEDVEKKMKKIKTLNLFNNKGEKDSASVKTSMKSKNSQSMNSIFNGNENEKMDKNENENETNNIDKNIRISKSSSSSRQKPVNSGSIIDEERGSVGTIKDQKRGSVSMIRSNLSTSLNRSVKTPLSYFPDGNESMRLGKRKEPVRAKTPVGVKDPGEGVPLRLNGPPICYPVWFIGDDWLYLQVYIHW